MIFEENLIYKHDIQEGEELPAEWTIILSWIGKSKTILETGCHTGGFSRRLVENGCRVTGMEINAIALENAKSFLHKAILGDLESPDAWDQLRDIKFDVILFEHVLEHLTNPWQILSNARNYLAENGIVIIALPNISNAVNRFDMLFGKFEYEEFGVMDKTHLRFFNQKTARELIAKSDFKVDDYAAPLKVNPIREFVDHLPVLTNLRFLFRKNSAGFPRLSSNITDPVMLFKCSPC